MKCIDAEKLKARIIILRTELISLMNRLYYAANYKEWKAKRQVYDNILDIINSLQQEQPDAALENEINAVWNPRFNLGWDEHSALSMNHADFASIARHFYELGLKARKENN